MITEAEIYTQIHNEIIDDVSIGATSPSKTSEHARITLTITRISAILQGLWEIFKRALEAKAETVPTCNAAWWDSEVRKFQFGDELLLDSITKKYYYAVIDEAKQIITRVSVTDQSGTGVIKVAKANNAELIAPEKAALTSFIEKVQPLGSNILMRSQAADIMQIFGIIHFDPIISEATVKANVELAINEYLEALSFKVGLSGVYYTSKLIDAIQAVEGVVDVTISSVFAGQFNELILKAIARKYTPISGHILIDENNTLADTLTYQPEI